MKNDDVELIQRILAGDETAFANLIRKYQRQVHTHALRKIGDFHIAEDITQETFLQVYQNLETLNDPMQFSRWLYAIVNHLCIAWHRKDRLQTQPLEETHISEIETEAYSRHVATEQAKRSAEAQRDLVKKLLAKLKDRDREVITLHYFEGYCLTIPMLYLWIEWIHLLPQRKKALTFGLKTCYNKSIRLADIPSIASRQCVCLPLGRG